MARASDPTERQKKFLEKHGIALPPTKFACMTLIEFMVKGNGTMGENIFARTTLLRKAQVEWIGQRVLLEWEHGQKTGTVVYIRARMLRDVQAIRKLYRDQYIQPHPFIAHVRCDGGGYIEPPLTTLRHMPEPALD